MEHRNACGEWIKSDPEPEGLRVTSQAGANLIELHMRDLQMTEGTRLARALACAPAREPPPGDGCMAMPKHPFGRRDVQSFCQCGSARAPPGVTAFSIDTAAYAGVLLHFV